MTDRQLTLPGLPVPQPKLPKTSKVDERLANIEGRLLQLEIEVLRLSYQNKGGIS